MTKKTTADLLDKIRQQLALKNDAALACELKISACNLSKVRNGKMPVGASILVRIHDATGLSLNQIRELMGAAPVLRRVK